MKTWIYAIAAACSLSLLTACNPLGTDNAIQPQPLGNIKSSLRVSPVWTSSVGNGDDGYYYRLTPAASQGKIFAGSYNGTLAAFDANSGRTIWTTRFKDPITSGIDAADGKVFFGTGSAKVFAVSAANGQRLWQVPVSSEVLAAPQYSQGVVLVHTFDGKLTALSAKDGHRLWRFDPTSMPSLVLHAASQPQVAGGNVIAGFANGQLSVLNLWTGQSQWMQPIAAPMGDNPVSQMIDITVDPVVVNGVVYVATYQGYIAALSLDHGQMLWNHKISSFAGIAADSSQVYVSDADSTVWAFDESSGAVNWKQTALRGRQITGPVTIHGAVAVADRTGLLNFMSKLDGHFVARLPLNSGALAKPTVYRNKLYVYTSRGNLVAVRVG